jgi:hypothetical protein
MESTDKSSQCFHFLAFCTAYIKEILSVFQMDLLLEADRIEDKLKECTSLLPSMFHDGVADSHLAAESQQFSRKEANVDIDSMNIIGNDATSAIENVENPIVDPTNPQHASVGSRDKNMFVSKEQPKKIRSFSKIKRIGARCCFAWPDETALYKYWGSIIESYIDDKLRKIHVVR